MTVGILCLFIFRKVLKFFTYTKDSCISLSENKIGSYNACKRMNMKAAQPKERVGWLSIITSHYQIHPFFFFVLLCSNTKVGLEIFFLCHLVQYQTLSIEGAGKTLKPKITCASGVLFPPTKWPPVNGCLRDSVVLSFQRVLSVTQLTTSFDQIRHTGTFL